jgi:Tc toxin complex TcA C-terminal TcB-binding domain
MLGQISASYFQAWQLTYRFGLRVERAFHFGLGPNDRGELDKYVRPGSWENMHNALLAADRLGSSFSTLSCRPATRLTIISGCRLRRTVTVSRRPWTRPGIFTVYFLCRDFTITRAGPGPTVLDTVRHRRIQPDSPGGGEAS